MKKVLTFILCLMLIVLIGCASTGYKKAKKPNKYGYFDSNVQNNIYEVQFRANHYTNTRKAYDYSILRCAELCIEEGYKSFSITSQQNATATASSVASYGNAYGYGNSAYGYGNSYVVTEVYPCYVNGIQCYKDLSGDFDAEQIRNNMIKKYNLKKLKQKYNIK